MSIESIETDKSLIAEAFIVSLKKNLIEKNIPIDEYTFKIGTDTEFCVGNSDQFGVFRENSDGTGVFYPIKLVDL